MSIGGLRPASVWEEECLQKPRQNISVMKMMMTMMIIIINYLGLLALGKKGCNPRKASASSDSPSSAEVQRAQSRKMQGRRKTLQ